MRALLIEPDYILAKQYTATLRSKGFVVDECYDPQIAMDLMDENKPDVIIMELQLVPLSGVAFLYELRSYEDFVEVPIIIYSSLPKENFNIDDRGWETLGIVKYLYKPRIDFAKVTSHAKGLFA